MILTETMIGTSPEDAKKIRGGKPVDPVQVWGALGWIGLTFLLVGGADFPLTWYPTSLGNREREVGTVTVSSNGLPIVVWGPWIALPSLGEICTALVDDPGSGSWGGACALGHRGGGSLVDKCASRVELRSRRSHDGLEEGAGEDGGPVDGVPGDTGVPGHLIVSGRLGKIK